MNNQPLSNPAPGASSRRPAGRRTWLWALLAFLTLSVCSLTAVMLAVSGGQLPEFGSGPSWTPPASDTRGPAIAEQQPATGLAIGDQVSNASSSGVRLRRTPGFQNKPGGDILATIAPGALGQVIGGPQEVDGLRWWLVRFATQEGWMAERTSQGILLLDRAG